MKDKANLWMIYITLIWSLLVMLAGLGYGVYKTAFPTPKPTWEYEIAFHDDFKLKEDLQQIGKAGWEIASTRRATSASGMFGYEIIYKRKVQ